MNNKQELEMWEKLHDCNISPAAVIWDLNNLIEGWQQKAWIIGVNK